MIENIKFRGKTLNYDPMTMPELAEGWYYQELHNGEMRHLITDGAHTFEVDGNTVEMVSGLFDKPLASRMTAKEKERVRKAYKAMSDYGKNKGVECASCVNYAARVWMERIFGADFFKKGE